MPIKIGRFIPNPAGIAAYERSGAARDAIRPNAERVLASAQANAPVITGTYRAGLHIEDGPDGGLLVSGSTDYDIYVEADEGVLNRALDAAGGS